MKRCSSYWLASGLISIVALVLGACGGGEATPTPPPTKAPSPTATPAPAPTTAPLATVAPTATPRPAPTPTPTPAAVSQAPVLLPPGKRGGTLVGRSLFVPQAWDTLDRNGASDVHTLAPMLNNIVFLDPYGDGKTLVGDLAEGWEFSAGGTVLTFRLRKGVKFHDGRPLTARDVAYDFDRAWKPRSPTMTYFRVRFAPIQRIETPDDLTVRLTLTKPSNVFLQAVSMSNFQMFPEHIPFPDKLDEWKANPVGSGPFKLKRYNAGVSLEYVRNADYWKPGLPYLDGYNIIQMSSEAAVSAFRTGRLDTTNLDPGAIGDFTDQLVKSTGFVLIWIKSSWHGIYFNQKPPWTDPRAREAVDLALQRDEIIALAYQGQGSPVWSPLMPPEFGGSWGISIETLKNRPGYRSDRKAEDVARAKQLLRDAGIDLGGITLSIVGSSQLKVPQEALDQSFRNLGFKTRLEPLDTAAMNDRLQNRQFDVYAPSTTAFFLDDPLDALFTFYHSEGPNNHGKWSDPALDELFAKQDATLDVAQRRQLLVQLQEKILDLRWNIGILWRFSATGHQPWMRNYPVNLPFLFNQRFRYEQAWLDRSNP